MTPRTLTRRHLNRALLARQLLLDRSNLSITGAVITPRRADRCSR
jgi:hypothetical protein